MRVCIFRGNKPKLGPFSFPDISAITKNPVKPSFSVPVEKKPYNRPVLENTADLHLTKSPPIAFKSSCFLPLILSHLIPETLPEHEYEGYFFRWRIQKLGKMGIIRKPGMFRTASQMELRDERASCTKHMLIESPARISHRWINENKAILRELVVKMPKPTEETKSALKVSPLFVTLAFSRWTRVYINVRSILGLMHTRSISQYNYFRMQIRSERVSSESLSVMGLSAVTL